MNQFALSALFLCLIRSCYGGLVGGQEATAVDDPEVVRLSELALVHLNNVKKGSGVECRLVEIVSASRQIVSGTLTTLSLKVSENDNHKYCTVKIWEQPWLNKTQITHSDCDGGENHDRNRRDSEFNLLMENFKSFIRKYNKVYADVQEFNYRFRIFRANMKKIMLLRAGEQGTAEYGITKFSDLSEEEFQKLLGLKNQNGLNEFPMAVIPDIELPEQFDWRSYNVVTEVKNQGSCGSCWAFSAIGNIESQWAINMDELFTLSEQQLLDCDESNFGCNGGYMATAFETLMKLGGVVEEKDYPYEAKTDTCRLKESDIKFNISGALNVTTTELSMAKWLVKNGPLSAGLNANAMQFYRKGVSHPPKLLCHPNTLNHGIVIVGIGIQQGRIPKRSIPYWIIKNSWGENWGEDGYYRLYRGKGVCGIDKYVLSATVV